MRRANSFSLQKGHLIEGPVKTSARDYRLKIRVDEYRDWSPGQFVMLRWGSHQIGRPFAIVDFKPSGNGALLDVWIRRLGAATEELYCAAHEGMSLWVTLPLGNGLDASVFEKKSKILLVSGGVGAASILPLARALSKDNRFWIHGERSPEDFDPTLQCNELCLESGAVDRPFVSGRVTAALEQARAFEPTHIVVCGPTPMLRAMGQMFLADRDFCSCPCFLGLEEKMGCGIGLCFSCSIKTKFGMRRSCTDGPWFEYKNIQAHFEFRGVRPDAR